MAIRATGGFGILRYEPGNPQFPTLPDGIIVGHPLTYPDGGGSRHYPAANRGYITKNIKASAPANDRTRYAGWQTETTWVNPSIINFGVIPSPVQRTVTLYNARSTPLVVTALSLPTGVTLEDPVLPVTLQPYAGDTFLLEAGTTGDNEFDEFHVFTTSEGDATFRLLGRRVFTLNVLPQSPMRETLRWRTDLIRSNDGTEKAYSLLQSPLTEVEYNVWFTDDLERIRFKNNFIAGASELVVAGQKWYEARPITLAALSTDTSLRVANVIDASWSIGGPISLVTEAGDVVAAQLDSMEFGPDPDYLSNVLVLPCDGADGATSAVDESYLSRGVTFGTGVEIDTAESAFGGSSILLGATHTQGVTIDYDAAAEIADNVFTVEFWMRPTAYDFSFATMPISRWHSTNNTRSWRVQMATDRIRWVINDGGTTYFDFVFSSPQEMVADAWHHVAFTRSDGDVLRCFINGVQTGGDLTMAQTLETGDAPTYLGGYLEGSFYNRYRGHIDDVRITIGIARYTADFTPPSAPFAGVDDIYLQFNLAAELGIAAPVGSKVMPVGLGYVSDFPRYATHADNLEEARYRVTFNQEADVTALDPTFPSLTDLQSPQNTIPVLDFCNEIQGRSKPSVLRRDEDSLNSGLTNRIAFSAFPFGDHVSDFRISLTSAAEVWKWRTFLSYLRGSYNDFFVPTFKNDIPGVTTAASNVFSAVDTDLALLFGDPPDPRRNAIRLLYPDGTVLYRMITDIVDNVATEQITVDSAVVVGNPVISYLQRSRILGDTATFTHRREGDVVLKFKYRTILL